MKIYRTFDLAPAAEIAQANARMLAELANENIQTTSARDASGAPAPLFYRIEENEHEPEALCKTQITGVSAQKRHGQYMESYATKNFGTGCINAEEYEQVAKPGNGKLP